MIRIVRPYWGLAAAVGRLPQGSHVYIILAATLLGTLLAYLVVADLWLVAVALLALLPAFVLLNKYPLLGLLGWLVLGQFLMTTETSALRMVYWAIHRALPPMTAFIIVLCSMLKINERKLGKPGWPELAMVGYLIVTQFSIFYLSGEILEKTYWLYDRVFIPMCLYLIVRLLAPTEEDLKRIAASVFVICLVQSLVGTLSWIAPSLLPSMWRGPYIGDRTVGTLVNPGVYTQVLGFSNLFMLHMALNHRQGLVRWMYIAAFLAANYCIFISFTRSSWLAAVVTGMGLIFLYPKFMSQLILIFTLVIGGVGGVLLSNQLDLASQRLMSAESEESALSRLPVYYAAYRMFISKPIFGWGYSNFDRYDRQFQARVADLVNPDKDHASHNLYLTIIAEQGLAGILLYTTPLFWWFFFSLKALPRMPNEGLGSRKLLAILWLAVAYFAIVNNFFNTTIVYSLGFWWITLALIATVVDRNLSAQDARRDPIKDRLIRIYQDA